MSQDIIKMKESLEDPTYQDNDFFVIGIGASAGGLKAIKQLLNDLPPSFDHPMVFLQHLNPDHKSHMKELLTNYTKMEIVEVSQITELKKILFIFSLQAQLYRSITTG